MRAVAGQTSGGSLERETGLSFADWALNEIERLLRARARAASDLERAAYDLHVARIYEAAHRIGASMVETVEL